MTAHLNSEPPAHPHSAGALIWRLLSTAFLVGLAGAAAYALWKLVESSSGRPKGGEPSIDFRRTDSERAAGGGRHERPGVEGESGRSPITKAQLYAAAREAGIVGRSKMTKDELRRALAATEG